jgi:hypothetical protein
MFLKHILEAGSYFHYRAKPYNLVSWVHLKELGLRLAVFKVVWFYLMTDTESVSKMMCFKKNKFYIHS